MKEEATYPNPYTNYAKEQLRTQQGVPSTESQILAALERLVRAVEGLDERLEQTNEYLMSINGDVNHVRWNTTKDFS